jgi:hypothetical protein
MISSARLPRDFGIDPETQNDDGTWAWPTVRRSLSFNSPERKLEREIVRTLLKHPTDTVIVDAVALAKVLGDNHADRIRDLGDAGLRTVSLLVGESCVRVSVQYRDSRLMVRIY